ncbi:hypothetical protein [Mucilaginibacter sp.]
MKNIYFLKLTNSLFKKEKDLVFIYCSKLICMQHSVLCPLCKSSSLSNNKIEDGIEITCISCGTTFKPGEGITLIKQSITYIFLGYFFAVLCLFLLPIIFLPLAIICGLCCIVDGYWRIAHGIIIIVLAIILARHGAEIGGWGFGISWERFHF